MEATGLYVKEIGHVSLHSTPASTLSPSFLLAQAIFEPNLFRYKYSNILKPSHSSYLSAYEDGTDSVPKRWHIKFRRWGITQKKAYNIQDTVKVWNQECPKQACLTTWPVVCVGGCRSPVAGEQTCTAGGEHAVVPWGQELQCRFLLYLLECCKYGWVISKSDRASALYLIVIVPVCVCVVVCEREIHVQSCAA